METLREQVTLNNPTGNPEIERVLDVIGRTVIRVTETWKNPVNGNDEVDTRLEFPEDRTRESDWWVACMGDDAIGSVVGAFNDGEDLILQAHYGDEGIFEYSMLSVWNPDAKRGKYNFRPDIYVIRKIL